MANFKIPVITFAEISHNSYACLAFLHKWKASSKVEGKKSWITDSKIKKGSTWSLTFVSCIDGKIHHMDSRIMDEQFYCNHTALYESVAIHDQATWIHSKQASEFHSLHRMVQLFYEQAQFMYKNLHYACTKTLFIANSKSLSLSMTHDKITKQIWFWVVTYWQCGCSSCIIWLTVKLFY